MTKIVWLASYPRSGNTWLRFLVGNLLYGNIGSSGQLAMTVPDIHRSVTGRHLMGPARCFIKTHWAWQPEFPLRENTESVVYLIRNPLDVMESSLHFALRGSGQFAQNAAPDEIDRFARDYLAKFIDHGGDAAWYREGYGSWESNAASWIDSALAFPRLVVRYEALRADPAATLAELARFVGLEADATRLADAIERSSMERLAAMEENEIRTGAPGFFYGKRSAHSSEKGVRFIGRGSVDGRRIGATDAERERARERFAPAMAHFGYS